MSFSLNQLNYQLIQAIEWGGSVSVKQLLTNGANPNCVIREKTPLTILVEKFGTGRASLSDYTTLDELLARGANVNSCPVPWKRSPLHAAIESGNVDLVTRMFKSGYLDAIPGLTLNDPQGKTSLEIAKESGNPAMEALISNTLHARSGGGSEEPLAKSHNETLTQTTQRRDTGADSNAAKGTKAAGGAGGVTGNGEAGRSGGSGTSASGQSGTSATGNMATSGGAASGAAGQSGGSGTNGDATRGSGGGTRGGAANSTSASGQSGAGAPGNTPAGSTFVEMVGNTGGQQAKGAVDEQLLSDIQGITEAQDCSKLDILFDALKHTDSTVRAKAAAAIGYVAFSPNCSSKNREDSIDALAAGHQDSDGQVREAIVKALTRVRNAEDKAAKEKEEKPDTGLWTKMTEALYSAQRYHQKQKTISLNT